MFYVLEKTIQPPLVRHLDPTAAHRRTAEKGVHASTSAERCRAPCGLVGRMGWNTMEKALQVNVRPRSVGKKFATVTVASNFRTHA